MLMKREVNDTVFTVTLTDEDTEDTFVINVDMNSSEFMDILVLAKRAQKNAKRAERQANRKGKGKGKGKSKEIDENIMLDSIELYGSVSDLLGDDYKEMQLFFRDHDQQLTSEDVFMLVLGLEEDSLEDETPKA